MTAFTMITNIIVMVSQVCLIKMNLHTLALRQCHGLLSGHESWTLLRLNILVIGLAFVTFTIKFVLL